MHTLLLKLRSLTYFLAHALAHSKLNAHVITPTTSQVQKAKNNTLSRSDELNIKLLNQIGLPGLTCLRNILNIAVFINNEYNYNKFH